MRQIDRSKLIAALLVILCLLALPATAMRLKKRISGISNRTFSVSWTSTDFVDGSASTSRASSKLFPTQLNCLATGTTDPEAQIARVVECDTNGANCVTMGLQVQTESTFTDVGDAVATDPSVASGNWWGIEMVSATIEADILHCTVTYEKD